MGKELNIDIEVMGHKAKIVYISGHIPPEWQKREDYIGVLIDLEEPIDGISGFEVKLPVRDYGKDEFITRVVREAEVRLPKQLAAHRAETERMLQKEERQKALNSIIEQIKLRLQT